jgi:hypothetical protein
LKNGSRNSERKILSYLRRTSTSTRKLLDFTVRILATPYIEPRHENDMAIPKVMNQRRSSQTVSSFIPSVTRDAKVV